MNTPKSQIDLAHRDICIAERWLSAAETEEARRHYGTLLSEAQRRLRIACEHRAKFIAR